MYKVHTYFSIPVICLFPGAATAHSCDILTCGLRTFESRQEVDEGVFWNKPRFRLEEGQHLWLYTQSTWPMGGLE